MLFAALAYLRAMPEAPAGAGYWTAGYGFWMLRLACYLTGGHLEPLPITFLAESLQATAALLLLMGTLCFVGRNPPVTLLAYAIAVVVLWCGFTTFVMNDFLLRSVPLYLAAGVALIVAGLALLRARRDEATPAAGLVGIALVAWGLHKFDYPWLRQVEWFAPFGFLLSELLAMLAAVGLLLIMAGRLRSLADIAEQRHVQSREHLATLNQLLQISLDSKPLHSQLSDALDTIIAAPWLALEPRGGIFLAEEGALRLVAHRNLTAAAPIGTTIPVGHCLCGRAIGEAAVVHAVDADGSHAPARQEMQAQAHYAVPILSGSAVLGVLVLYPRNGHEQDEPEIAHLRAVADLLAGIIVRKRAEAEVEESRSRFVDAQRIARVGSWETDLRSGVSIWSDEQFRILGYQPGEVATHTDSFLARVHPDDIKRVQAALSAVEHVDTFAVDHRVVHADGTVLFVNQVAEVVRDEAGRATRMIGTCQDVTEHKSVQLALLRAKQTAETANRAKSSFLATMSHELRTPLNAVIGFAQLLEQDRFGPVSYQKYKEYIGHIRESGEHLLAVINDILDLSRVEAGESGLHEGPVDLADLVQRTAGLMEAKVRAGSLTLAQRLPADLPLLYADERAIKQILLNLLANAIKFTRPGGEVVVEAKLLEDGLNLTVSDTGIGIAAADQAQIFEPFYQVESELNRRFEGTGLGLSIVRSLVELHEASVSLESAPGQGTRVRVRFPVQRLLPREPAPQAKGGPSRG